jgi:hypothetical protein
MLISVERKQGQTYRPFLCTQRNDRIIYRKRRQQADYSFSKEGGSGYQYEARHKECLRQGLIESPVMTHADSLLFMETMDRIREAAGIHYTADKIG